MLLTVKMNTREDSCQNVCVFVTGEGGLCLELSCMLSAKRDPPSCKNTVPSQKDPPVPQKRKDFTDRKKNVSSLPPLSSSIVHFQTPPSVFTLVKALTGKLSICRTVVVSHPVTAIINLPQMLNN